MFKEEVYHETQSEALLMAILLLVPDLRCIGGTGFPGYLKHFPALKITGSDWKPWLARAPFLSVLPLPAEVIRAETKQCLGNTWLYSVVQMKLHLVCQRQGWEWEEQAGSCLLCGSDKEKPALAAPFFLQFFYYFSFPSHF